MGTEKDSDRLTNFANFLDKISTAQIRSRMRRLTEDLYRIAREMQTGPLTLLAAETISKSVSKGDAVVITAGAGHGVNIPKGETDGPPGAAVLGLSIAKARDAKIVLVAEDDYMGPIVECYHSLGLDPIITPFPKDHALAKEATEKIFAQHNPRLVVSIERLGPNSKGVMHSLMGEDWSMFHGALHEVVLQGTKHRIPSIGVGDGGNEIGAGRIVARARPFILNGEMCKCPCKGGTACAIPTDVFTVGATSNWGAYAIAACLSALTKHRDAFHTPALERILIERCVSAGAKNGPSATSILAVDDVTVDADISLVQLISEALNDFLSK
jgi:hypothetical protein